MKKFIAFVLAFVLCCTSCITAFAADTTKNVISTETLQSKEDEANAKYNQLLREWAHNPEYIDDICADFPSFYGGAYIDSEKNLVIQVTELSDANIAYFSSIIDLDNVQFEVVNFSFSELMAEYEAILSQIKKENTRVSECPIDGVGLSMRNNAINLYIIQPENAIASTYSIQETIDTVTTFENIRIIESTEQDATCATVEPGSGISNGNYNRSVGFWAYDEDDNLGIVTAPHSSIASGDTIKIGSSTFGTADTPYFSGEVDAVFIRRTNSSFTPTRNITGWDFDLQSSGYTILAEGSTTYSKGITSGCQTGEIIDISYSTSYGISNCVVTSAPCASGDSGGIVAGSGNSTSRYVAGIITGTRGGTNYIIYVKISKILSTLDLSVY